MLRTMIPAVLKITAALSAYNAPAVAELAAEACVFMLFAA